MKPGMTLQQFATELQAQQERKLDFITDTRHCNVRPVRSALMLESDQGVFEMDRHTTRQMSGWANVPLRYVDKMSAEAPDLLATNLNHWLHETPSRRMVRAWKPDSDSVHGTARAFLSDRYRRIDNFDVAMRAIPILNEFPDVRLEYAQLTDNFMHLKAVLPRIEGEVKRGDLVQSGIYIRNSEIGLSAFEVAPLLFRLVCLNGMIAQDSKVRKLHMGARADQLGITYRDETLAADDRALMMVIEDTVRSVADRNLFEGVLEKAREAAESDQMERPAKATEVLGSSVGLLESESQAVLAHLIRGGDLTQWGALNAITRYAQDVEDHDRSQQLEAIGGIVLNFSAKEWRDIARAA